MVPAYDSLPYALLLTSYIHHSSHVDSDNAPLASAYVQGLMCELFVWRLERRNDIGRLAAYEV